MPTLQELTLAHSQRLSEVYRTRDVRLAEAQAIRDLQLRALAEAARAFQKYDDELASARERQLATDAKAEAARTSAQLVAIDRRSDRLEDAQMARRSTDVEAVKTRRRIEDAAEAKYLAALSAAREAPDAQRGRLIQDADLAHRLEFEQARRTHDETLAKSQQHYRASVDEALLAERREGRDGERGYFGARRGRAEPAGGAVGIAGGPRNPAGVALAGGDDWTRDGESGEGGVLALSPRAGQSQGVIGAFLIRCSIWLNGPS